MVWAMIQTLKIGRTSSIYCKLARRDQKPQSSPSPAAVLDPKPRPTAAISTEVELDSLLQSHPTVMALTSWSNDSTRKAAAKARMYLRIIALDDYERLVLMDSGSSVNGIHVGSVIPKYLPHVRESEAQKQKDELQLVLVEVGSPMKGKPMSPWLLAAKASTLNCPTSTPKFQYLACSA